MIGFRPPQVEKLGDLGGRDMRSVDEVRAVAEMARAGLSTSEICRRTGIPWSTVRGWRTGRTRRNALLDTAASCARCGRTCLPIAAAKEPSYAYLLGQYLGDGSIFEHRRQVHRLVIYGDARYAEITNEVAEAMGAVSGNKVGRHLRHDTRNCAVISAYSRAWPCLFPQHGPGPKHLRRIKLEHWQERITHEYAEAFVRGLIHSDGCRSINAVRGKNRLYRYPRYTFTNKSEDIKRIFCEHLDLLEIPWRRMNAMNILVARREALARLDEFVGPKA